MRMNSYQNQLQLFDKLEIVDCEMAPGDAVFFHGNTIHGSQKNTTNDTRIFLEKYREFLNILENLFEHI